MAALVCLECTAVYSVDAEKCPQCGATQSRGDWEEAAAPGATVTPRAKKAPTPAPDATAGGADQ